MFTLYQNGRLVNTDQLNGVGKKLAEFIAYCRDHRVVFFDRITNITVTSMHRPGDPKTSAHYKNLAIDLVVTPVPLMLYFACLLYRYRGFNLYMGTTRWDAAKQAHVGNLHLHVDEDFSNHPQIFGSEIPGTYHIAQFPGNDTNARAILRYYQFDKYSTTAEFFEFSNIVYLLLLAQYAQKPLKETDFFISNTPAAVLDELKAEQPKGWGLLEKTLLGLGLLAVVVVVTKIF